MVNRERVIKGANCCITRLKKTGTCGFECPYKNNPLGCKVVLLKDVLSIVAEQEPRVMTLKEIVSAECVWIEYATSENIVIALPWNIELTDDTYNFIGMPNCFVEFRSLYGEEWRCWTSRPTDEQRKATPWVETPKEET